MTMTRTKIALAEDLAWVAISALVAAWNTEDIDGDEIAIADRGALADQLCDQLLNEMLRVADIDSTCDFKLALDNRPQLTLVPETGSLAGTAIYSGLRSHLSLVKQE
jgi:hypothetical protein